MKYRKTEPGDITPPDLNIKTTDDHDSCRFTYKGGQYDIQYDSHLYYDVTHYCDFQNYKGGMEWTNVEECWHYMPEDVTSAVETWIKNNIDMDLYDFLDGCFND